MKEGIMIEATMMSNGNDIEVLTVELSNVTITSVYKPPAEDFKLPLFTSDTDTKPQIFSSDFNSHSTQWGYKETNNDGAVVEEWIAKYQLSFIHDPKLPPSFHSAHWMRGYNPDLAIVTNNISDMSADWYPG